MYYVSFPLSKIENKICTHLVFPTPLIYNITPHCEETVCYKMSHRASDLNGYFGTT